MYELDLVIPSLLNGRRKKKKTNLRQIVLEDEIVCGLLILFFISPLKVEKNVFFFFSSRLEGFTGFVANKLTSEGTDDKRAIIDGGRWGPVVLACPVEGEPRTSINQIGDSSQGDLIGDSLNL